MADRTEDPLSLAGTTLAGRFLVEEPVASGGFGVVYRARQRELDRPVAIKVLRILEDLPAAAVERRLECFRREARLVAGLAHPAIVQVIDFGVAPVPSGGVAPWMAMEWLAGETLETWRVERRGAGGLSPREALALLRPAFEALRAAHACGVAHRDIKPANLMRVRLADGRHTVKVLDFGIARVMGAEDIPGSGQTATGSPSAPFSPRYVSPEQVSHARTGPWTDVHALALVMTEVLVGRRAYPSTDATALCAAALASERPTPETFGVRVGPWEAVLARALALRPDARHADAGAFLDALDDSVAEAERVHAVEAPAVPLDPLGEVTEAPDTRAALSSSRGEAPHPKGARPFAQTLAGVVAFVIVSALFVSRRGPHPAPAPLASVAPGRTTSRPVAETRAESPAAPTTVPAARIGALPTAVAAPQVETPRRARASLSPTRGRGRTSGANLPDPAPPTSAPTVAVSPPLTGDAGVNDPMRELHAE